MQLCAACKAGEWGEVSIPDPMMSRTARCNHVLPGKPENGEFSIPDPIMSRTTRCNHVLSGKLEKRERLVFQTQCSAWQGAIVCCLESWGKGRN